MPLPSFETFESIKCRECSSREIFVELSLWSKISVRTLGKQVFSHAKDTYNSFVRLVTAFQRIWSRL